MKFITRYIYRHYYLRRFAQVLSTLLRKILYHFYRISLVNLERLSCYNIPLPELGLIRGNPVTSGKGLGSSEKWQIMDSLIPHGAETALDIGCNNGFFTLRLAKRGIFTIGVDPDMDLIRLAQLAAFETNQGLAAFSLLAVDQKNISLLPEVDVTLVLSVAHRWVRNYGRSAADAIVATLWEKTRKIMFFETPDPCQNIKEAPFLFYMGRTESECEHFVLKWLGSLENAKVSFLGALPTDFRPGETRRLFAVKRTDSSTHR